MDIKIKAKLDNNRFFCGNCGKALFVFLHTGLKFGDPPKDWLWIHIAAGYAKKIHPKFGVEVWMLIKHARKELAMHGRPKNRRKMRLLNGKRAHVGWSQAGEAERLKPMRIECAHCTRVQWITIEGSGLIASKLQKSC